MPEILAKCVLRMHPRTPRNDRPWHVGLAVRAYPRSWRERYGEELLLLVAEIHAAEGRVSLRDEVNLLWAGLCVRVRTLAAAPSASRGASVPHRVATSVLLVASVTLALTVSTSLVDRGGNHEARSLAQGNACSRDAVASSKTHGDEHRYFFPVRRVQFNGSGPAMIVLAENHAVCVPSSAAVRLLAARRVAGLESLPVDGWLPAGGPTWLRSNW